MEVYSKNAMRTATFGDSETWQRCISLSLYIVTSRKDHGLVHRAALIVFPGIRQLCQHYRQRKYRLARVNFWRRSDATGRERV